MSILHAAAEVVQCSLLSAREPGHYAVAAVAGTLLTVANLATMLRPELEQLAVQLGAGRLLADALGWLSVRGRR